MKKQIITLALASGLIAPAVMADTVNVNVYGRIRGAVEAVNSSGAMTGNNQTNQLRVVNNVSVLGFKGVEDLGDGLLAMWQAEGTFSADGDKDGAINSRNTFFALKDSWGTVLVGKNDTPYKLSRKPLVAEILEDSTVQMAAIFAKYNSGAQNFYTRQNSTVQYHSPSWAGFDFKIGFAPDETKTTATNKTRVSASAAYNNDMLFATIAYETRADATATDSASAVTINGGYKFGKNGTVGLGLEEFKVGSANQQNLLLSANYTVNEKINIGLNYAVAGEYNDVANSGASMLTLGAQYTISKRTSVVAYASSIRNDAAAKYNFSENSIDGLVVGKDPRVIGLGFTQKF